MIHDGLPGPKRAFLVHIPKHALCAWPSLNHLYDFGDLFPLQAGPQGPQGPQGATGPQGDPGVVSATAPITYASQTVGLSVGTGLTTSSGALVADFGSTSGKVCQGNDARLSDSRTPTTHTHAASDIASGTIATARLGSGTPSASTFLRGDQTYAPTSAVYDFTRTAAPADATGAAPGPYTWTIPAGAKSLRMIAIGGGGGGGSGRRFAAGNPRFGGGGGAGAPYAETTVSVAELSGSTLTVTVGAGGAGGAAQTADDTNGNNGTAGGLSKVIVAGTNASALVYGPSMGAGGGGSATAGSSGFSNPASESGGAGIASSITATPGGSTGVIGTTNLRGSTGGGGGGGIDASNVSRLGGGAQDGATTSTDLLGVRAGTGGTTAGASGSNGGSAVLFTAGGLGGGGGAAGNATTAGGNGGNGGFPGGGGGGGGAAFNGYASGAGGNGANGMVRIVVYF